MATDVKANVKWYQKDVIRDEWDSDFDVVVIGANFLFNIVTDIDYEEAQKLLIRKAAAALVPEGHVYIDYGYTKCPEKWFNNSKELVIWEGTDSEGNFGKMSLLNSEFDEKSGMNRFIRRYEMKLANGEFFVQDIPSEKHFITLEQIHEWLSCSGFIIEKEFGDYQKNPISEKTSRAIIWAKRK